MPTEERTRQAGTLFLIPTLLGEASPDSSLPPLLGRAIGRLTHFLVEDEKNARAFIRVVAPHVNPRELVLERLDEHTPPSDIPRLMKPLQAGIDMGVLSDAGCPAVADPGSLVVRRAHELGIPVRPLVGPCSMLLGLMASGLSGQRWRFVGYLPVDDAERANAIKRLEHEVSRLGETQIVMETPYRNQKLLDDLLRHCTPETRLCVASAVTTPAELIQSHTIEEWRKLGRSLPKTPTVFLLGR